MSATPVVRSGILMVVTNSKGYDLRDALNVAPR